jgi:hypothetical protein
VSSKTRTHTLFLFSLAAAIALIAVLMLANALASTQAEAVVLVRGLGEPPQPAPQQFTASSITTARVGYGMNVRDPAHIDSLFAPLGFGWIKLYEQYDELGALPTERLPYNVLYRVQLNGPPDNPNLWGDHVASIAQAGLGLVEAYEIGNEPNQSWQWGDRVPDPDEYVAAIKVAYARIKAVDPSAIVVSGGLGPVGRIQATPAGNGWPGNNGLSMDEWEYARALFARCGSGCFDVFGYHPFGFASSPEVDPNSVANNFAFRGAEHLRQIMLAHGLSDKPMWATEFGWIRDPNPDGFGWCKLRPEFNEIFGWMLVSELQQADYLSRAFAYADAHWPWMETMFVWNMDWNDQGWACQDVRFFSLFHVAGDPAPAYETMMTMARGPVFSRCPLQAAPARTLYLVDQDPPEHITGTVDLPTGAGCDSVFWNVSLNSGSSLQLKMPAMQGQLGDPFTFTIDTIDTLTEGTGTVLIYPTGTYTAQLTFATAPIDVSGSPQTVSIRLVVASKLYQLYLPVSPISIEAPR